MLEWMRDKSRDSGSTPLDIEPTTNLIETGILDSVDFLDLITFVEEKSGQSIDITSVDPDDLVSINGLCRHLEKQRSEYP
jgi:acyl carrier protein